jgi:hypothetical protein
VARTTQNGLLFGEGNPPEGYSARGCRPFDIGYNLEESLPNLALYVHLSGDAEVRDALLELLRGHLEFILPDGAIDNSWGTRNFKWTYWGTRNGDGCQIAYALMAEHDARFATAALRNVQLLARCTRDGLLDGGPHYGPQGEVPCIHHTFCHARSLAAVLDFGVPETSDPPAELPREIAAGVREYPESLTWLAARGPWRATVTAYDWVYDRAVLPAGHAGGGALTILHHAALGPICAASVTEHVLVEPSNMQPAPSDPPASLTPRLELRDGGLTYSNLNDPAAEVRWTSDEGELRFEVTGHLRGIRQQDPEAGPQPFSLTYVFTDEVVTLRAQAPGAAPGSVRLILPIISPEGEVVAQADRTVVIAKLGGDLRVEASRGPAGGASARIFHPVPGFQALPLAWELAPNETLEVRLRRG